MPTTISGDTGVNQITDGTIQTADFAAGVGPILTKYYESPEQTITVGGTLTLAHGLGVAPKLFQALIICKTVDIGYAVGDVLFMSNDISSSVADSYGSAFTYNGTTNIDVKFGSGGGYHVPNKGTGGGANITVANWRLIVRAWA